MNRRQFLSNVPFITAPLLVPRNLFSKEQQNDTNLKIGDQLTDQQFARLLNNNSHRYSFGFYDYGPAGHYYFIGQGTDIKVNATSISFKTDQQNLIRGYRNGDWNIRQISFDFNLIVYIRLDWSITEQNGTIRKHSFNFKREEDRFIVKEIKTAQFADGHGDNKNNGPI